MAGHQPVFEGDFEQLVNAENAVANADVLVLPPMETAIEVTVASTYVPGTQVSVLADWIANNCNLCLDNTAVPFQDFNTHQHADGQTTIFVFDLYSPAGLRQAHDMFLHMATRNIPFVPNTRFAMLAFGADHRIIGLIRSRLINMGAMEVLEPFYIVAPDVEVRANAVTNWQEAFGDNLVRLWRQMAVPQQVFVARAQNPDVVYQIFPEDHFAPIELSSDGVIRGHIYQGFALYRQGDVFVAPSEEDVVIVAIKRLFTGVARQLLANNQQENPWREAYRLQTLGDDVHVPQLVDALDDGQCLYIITRWANGGSLDQYVNEPLAMDDARGLFLQMVAILQYIHGLGVAHRDIKPANFLVYDGRLRLIDFGMSYIIPPGGIVRHHGVRFGTPAYMLPEHWRGEAYMSEQYDIWAVGICLFFLVTGMHYVYEFPSQENFLYAYILGNGLLTRNPNDVDGLLMQHDVSDRVQEALDRLDVAAMFAWEDLQL